MKLSIISPNIFKADQLSDFLHKLKNQNSQDFEIILVVNNNSRKIFRIIEEYLLFFGPRLKFVLNLQKKITQDNIMAAFGLVKGEFVTIINVNNNIKHKLVSDLIDLVKEPADIIEFLPSFTHEIRWKMKERIKKGFYQDFLSKNSEIFAYTAPIISNKIYSKKVVNTLMKFKPLELGDGIFCIELLYLLMLNAKSYKMVNEYLYKEEIKYDYPLNLKILLDEFDKIKSFINVNNIKLSHEIEYAEFYFVKAFLGTIVKTYKSNTFYDWIKNKEIRYWKKEKIHEQILKYIVKKQTMDSNFFTTNFYINQPKFEAIFLKNTPSIKSWENLIDKI
ncbi:Glycosyltransferase [Mycoplasmopsis meleagridis]|uniref:Glycosyltransferase n=1 Tax=Mycoplasmopsis meleagridis ATCC 25294 TaxID=1264554 RepID=A0A0F5H228_9BACT|nr:glycosyltransferase [Mycoplasmopsis meleagridis]KKB26897.1 Glycosyltransferase [Mycoplasmopsis meleagridis ATCC 25294]OAD18273.1 Glycosyltransferase [Mycoplasmopsis meleagridis]VEU77553.1 Glycosyl transferase family 2 [Mycoplasmopsis meleagridis]